jgi:hypothetical protein
VNRHGRPSMKTVYKSLGGETELLIKSSLFDGYVCRKAGQKQKARGVDSPDCEDSIVIRWGSRAPITSNQKTVTYNRNEAVEKTNSKDVCRRILRENNVAIPKTYFPNEDMSKAIFPLIGRPSHHGQGRHVFTCLNLEDVKRAQARGCTYFSEIYPKKREIRVHCFMGKVLAVVEKPKPDDDKLVWNRAQNDKPFEVVDRKDWPMEAVKVALQACEVMGLDFSGVDVMLDAEGDHPKAVICELNSAPTINSSPYVMDKYVKAFSWLFASETRRPKWAFNSFKKVVSLSWKEEQLVPDFEIPEEKQLKV